MLKKKVFAQIFVYLIVLNNFLPMKILNIAGLNFNMIWKNKSENFKKLEEDLKEVKTDILLLPEMFSTGFCMQAEEIADQNEETLSWLKKLAKEKSFAVCGSASIKENENYFNRFYFVKPNGEVVFYDKRHLFSFAGEDKIYTAGNDRVIVNFKGFRILLQVCYDVRFPVFSRNNQDYDAIFYVANWPETRIDAWKTLLKARAIENQCYVFGLNRIGTDGNNLTYPESSYCFFADGSEISETKNTLVTAELNLTKLEAFRNKFQFLSDRDSFEIL